MIFNTGMLATLQLSHGNGARFGFIDVADRGGNHLKFDAADVTEPGGIDALVRGRRVYFNECGDRAENVRHTPAE